MKKETKSCLNFVDHKLNHKNVTTENLKEYLRRLPHIYNGDILFAYYLIGIGNYMQIRKAWLNPQDLHRRFDLHKASKTYWSAGQYLHNLNYQYRELILFHARTDLRNKSLLEIEDHYPMTVIWLPRRQIIHQHWITGLHWCRVRQIIYVNPWRTWNETYNLLQCRGDRKESNIKFNWQYLFVACFEHIYDLPTALESCYECNKTGGTSTLTLLQYIHR